VSTNSQSISRFDYRAALCQPDDLQECWRIQKVIGEVCIVLEQNIIDTAVNERKNHLWAWHFEHFLLQAVEKQTIGWTTSPSDRNEEKGVFMSYFG